ncbi:hypothetical protein DM02DRAFT_658016 [Periconia macrospinosa]|uniref:GPI anchored serine-rich protein n=1 Tax=Periconia macrospinosa TaxID=97972 RepID=A0A2V1DHN1_9PLEO|nr:hypothetical protein DM02DRAFT_658016 [Periconia macrospinosa]
MIASKLFVIVATALGMAAAHNGLIEQRGECLHDPGSQNPTDHSPLDDCVSVPPATVTVTVTKCDSELPTPPISSSAAAPPPVMTTNPGVPSSSSPASIPGSSGPASSGPVMSATGPVTGPGSAPATTGSVATSTSVSSSHVHSNTSPAMSGPAMSGPAQSMENNGEALPTAFPGVLAAGVAAMVALA